MEEKRITLTDTNGGYWNLFWNTLILFGTFVLIAFAIGNIVLDIMMIIIIILLIAYHLHSTRRVKTNKLVLQIKNEAPTGKRYLPGPSHIPFRKSYADTLIYYTGPLAIEIHFEEFTVGTDDASGIGEFRFQVNPENALALYQLTNAETNPQKLKGYITELMDTQFSQILGLACKALSIKNGLEFEEKSKSGEISDFVGTFLTGVEGSYVKGVKSAFVEKVKLDLTNVALKSIVVKGEVYEATKEAQAQGKKNELEQLKAGASEAKEGQFIARLNAAYKAKIKFKKDYGKIENPILTEEELNKLYDDVLESHRLENGAEVFYVKGSSNMNQSEFNARVAADKFIKKEERRKK